MDNIYIIFIICALISALTTFLVMFISLLIKNDVELKKERIKEENSELKRKQSIAIDLLVICALSDASLNDKETLEKYEFCRNSLLMSISLKENNNGINRQIIELLKMDFLDLRGKVNELRELFVNYFDCETKKAEYDD